MKLKKHLHKIFGSHTKEIQPTFSNVPQRPPIVLEKYYKELKQYYHNCELETKKWFVENAGSDWVYIDAGANVGIYSILFSMLSPQGFIYAFEPTDTVCFLEKNLEINKCENVKILQNALGSKSGHFDEKVFKIWGQKAETCKQPFTSVDDFCRKEKINKLDCIKIDVDSYDLEVLEGSVDTLMRFNPFIVVELNHALAKRNRSNSEAFEFLGKLGYEQAMVLEHENFVLKRGLVFSGNTELTLKYR
ncbi:MAG: FkbM family methyltransferase [Proteobacteria bacterium]|nr:FkbM family methyltransferase [Pseudomonadota bacterium]